MLIDIDSGRPIERIPFRDTFDLIKRRLSEEEFSQVVGGINERIDKAGGKIATAGWLPGSDWSGTPFWCLYTKAAMKNTDLAAKMFGLMVWFTVMERPERWGSGRYKVNDHDIGSRTYFILGSHR